MISMLESFEVVIGNWTYFVPFYVNALISSQGGIFVILQIVEIAVGVFNVFFLLALISVQIRVQTIHPNLTVIIVFYEGIVVLLHFSQFTTAILNAKPNPNTASILGVNAFRLFTYVYTLNVLFFLLIERCCATVYARDYESNHRIFISISLNIANVFMSTMFALLVFFNILNGAIYFFCALLPNCVAVGIYEILLRRNSRILQKLSTSQTWNNYTLGLRVQLQENVWTMKLIQKAQLMIFVMFLLTIPSLLLPAIFLQGNVYGLQIFNAACNAGLNLVFVTAFCIVTIFIPPYRYFFLKKYTCGIVKPARTASKAFDAKMASARKTDHFTQMRSLWGDV